MNGASRPSHLRDVRYSEFAEVSPATPVKRTSGALQRLTLDYKRPSLVHQRTPTLTADVLSFAEDRRFVSQISEGFSKK